MTRLILFTTGTVTASAVGLVARGLRRRFVAIRVIGSSMNPTLRDGQRLIARRCNGSTLRAGQIAVFRVASEWAIGSPPLRVKRIAAEPGEIVPKALQATEVTARHPDIVPRGCFAVAGDAPRSQGTRELGFVRFADVVAVVPDHHWAGLLFRTGPTVPSDRSRCH
jgi:signal peptidase I